MTEGPTDDGSGAARDEESVVRRERFAGGPARSFLSSLAADERLFEATIAVDRAHVVMLAEQDIVGADVAGDILGALSAIAEAGHDALPEGEDVQEAVETAVVDRLGPQGGSLHTARSRNDEVATEIRVRLRADLLDSVETVLAARETVLDLAGDHTETLAPGYTHLQSAQPTTVAHWLASYEQALGRDTARLLDAYARVNRNPLGAVAFAGTPFDVDRERTADLLGFDGIVENAMDAASARDFLVETTAAYAALATTLSGLAEDVVVFASKGHLELADEYASTSSVMPQKKNPDTLELVRARTGDAVSGLTGVLTTLKGLPRAYNRDLQRATTHLWDSVDAVTESVPVATGALRTATWPEETLAAAAGEGFSTATGVADRLAMAGVPFRSAHEVVARAAREADGDTPDANALDAASRAVLDRPLAELVDVTDIDAALDPWGSVAMRDSRGGPAPSAVAAQLDRARETLAEHRERAGGARDGLDASDQRLTDEVARYA